MKKAFSSLMTLVLAFGIGLVAVLAPPIAPMDMASAEDTDPEVCLESLGPGRYLRLSGPSVVHNRAWAGQFNMTVAGVPYKGWCIDTINPIGLWCFDATLSDAPRATPWCEIGHILTNYSPDSDDDLAAIIQLALWKYMYGEHAVIATWPTSPPIEDMALDIYHDADGNVIGPGSGLSLVPDGVITEAAGIASQKFTATISDSGCLAGIPIDFSLNFSTGTGSFSPDSALTDGAGKASVTVSWDASQSSYEFTITAHTEGDWPVRIHPDEAGPRGETIQETIISEHYALTARESMAQEQEEELGSLEVTKIVDWDGIDPIDGQTFTICIEGATSAQSYYGSPNCKTFTYPGDLTKTWTNLKLGQYTVTETGAGSEWTVVVTGSPATVVTGETASAEVTNTYECVARVEGYKFANQCCSNGTWDLGEPPVPDWEIYLIDYADYILGDYASKITTITDANGLFYFDVAPGLYVVFEETWDGWTACTVENLSRCWPLRDWYLVYVSAADCGQTITVDVYLQNLLFGNKPPYWPWSPASATAMSPQGSSLLAGPVCDDEE